MSAAKPRRSARIKPESKAKLASPKRKLSAPEASFAEYDDNSEDTESESNTESVLSDSLFQLRSGVVSDATSVTGASSRAERRLLAELEAAEQLAEVERKLIAARLAAKQKSIDSLSKTGGRLRRVPRAAARTNATDYSSVESEGSDSISKFRTAVNVDRHPKLSPGARATPLSAVHSVETTLRRQLEQQQNELDVKQRAYERELSRQQAQANAEIHALKSRISTLESVSSSGTAIGRKQSVEAVESQTASAAKPGDVSVVAQFAKELAGALKQQSGETGSSQRTGHADPNLQHFVARQSASKDLPLFSGDPAEWPMFHHLYESSTRECGFSDAENVARLQRSLKGKARDTVQSMLALPSNLSLIMETLASRFGQPDYVVQTVIEKARSLKSIKSDELESLIDLSNSVNNLVTTMKLMDCTGHMQNPQLRQELVQKLPVQMRLAWGEHIAMASEVDLQTFSDWRSERAKAACRVRQLRDR